jgi:hypothetical protein
MATNPSVAFYLRFVNERFAVLRQSLIEFNRKLTQHDAGQKMGAAKSLSRSIDELKVALSQADHPGWIAELESQLHAYINQQANNTDAGLNILNTIVRLSPVIAAQKWQFDESSGKPAIDFSAIFREAYDASRVPQLFEELIGHIQTIIDSGAIDSMRVLRSLEELIALIRKNARGDVLSSGKLLAVVKRFFVNLGLEGLESIPIVKMPVKALRKTLADLDVEMAQVYQTVKQALIEQTGSDDLPMLEYTPSPQLALPAPTEGESVDAAVMEKDAGESAPVPAAAKVG